MAGKVGKGRPEGDPGLGRSTDKPTPRMREEKQKCTGRDLAGHVLTKEKGPPSVRDGTGQPRELTYGRDQVYGETAVPGYEH